jgi:hypothetical protein
VADGRVVDLDEHARHIEGVSMMQKLVTIRLEAPAAFNPSKRHGAVEEHLQRYLDDGWVIGSVAGLGGYYGGWVIVSLEKESER